MDIELWVAASPQSSGSVLIGTLAHLPSSHTRAGPVDTLEKEISTVWEMGGHSQQPLVVDEPEQDAGEGSMQRHG